MLAGIFVQWVIFSCHPTLSSRMGTWSFALISILSSVCERERMRVNKLESRSCNNMPRYSLLMPIGDSVSLVLSRVCFSFFVSAVIDLPVIMSFCCVSVLSVHMCVCEHVLWGCWQCILQECACKQRVCNHFSGSKCFFLLLSWSASYLILSRWNW